MAIYSLNLNWPLLLKGFCRELVKRAELSFIFLCTPNSNQIPLYKFCRDTWLVQFFWSKSKLFHWYSSHLNFDDNSSTHTETFVFCEMAFERCVTSAMNGPGLLPKTKLYSIFILLHWDTVLCLLHFFCLLLLLSLLKIQWCWTMSRTFWHKVSFSGLNLQCNIPYIFLYNCVYFICLM